MEKEFKYKIGCIFRKVNQCNFKVEDCNPKDCDFYRLTDDIKVLIKEKKLLQSKLKSMKEDRFKLKHFKDILNKEKLDKKDSEVNKFKIDMLKYVDYEFGLKSINKAIIYLKRVRK